MEMAPFRILMQNAYSATTQNERESYRSLSSSQLRRRFNLEVIHLAGQLHYLRPKLVLPPLALLGSVLATGVAN